MEAVFSKTKSYNVLDLFAGGGGSGDGILSAYKLLDLKAHGTFVNHSESAIKIHKHNHGGHTHLCTGVDDVDIDTIYPEGTKLHFLWGSPECFPVGTLILTKDKGMVPIEDVKVGCWVLTHQNRWRKVKRLFSKMAETVTLKGHGHYGLVTTREHPFYSKRITRRWDVVNPATKKRCGAQRDLVENPYWVKAENMQGKLWATPHSVPVCDIPACPAELSSSFFYFVGRWLGDGSINKGDVEISYGDHETLEFERHFSSKPLRAGDGSGIPRRNSWKGTAWTCAWGYKALADWLTLHFGKGAGGKQIPTWCLGLQRNWKASLLQGYMDADGHSERRAEASSVSKKLALGMRLIAVSLGKAASFYYSPARTGRIEGRAINGKEQWRTAWTSEPKNKTVHQDSKHMFATVKSVEPTGKKEMVFNLEVDEDESYVADGIVVHNCTHHSVARGGKPVNAQSRATAWCLVRWIRRKRPDQVLVENVREFLDWGPVMQKRCSKTGKHMWTYTAPGQTCKKPKTVETTEVPFNREKSEDRRTWCKRLASVGYEMSLTADKRKKGRTFRKWRRELMKLGYIVSHRVICSADYGDPTTRRRLYVQCVRIGSGKVIVWPNTTHCKPDKEGKVAKGMRRWRSARDILDFKNLGTSIIMRSKRLADKTMRRIILGLIKYAFANLSRLRRGVNPKPFMVPKDAGWDGENVRRIDDPVSTITTEHRGEGLAQTKLTPFALPQQVGGAQVKSIDDPVGTVTTKPGEAVVFPHISPFLVQQHGNSTAHGVDAPFNTVVGGPKHYLLNPALIKIKGTSTTNSVDLPLDTVAAQGTHHAIIQAFMMATDQQGSNGSCVHGLEDPVKTVITKQNQAVVSAALEPVVIQTAHGVDEKNAAYEHTRVKSADDTLGAIHAGGGSYAVMQAQMAEFLVPGFGERDGQSPRSHDLEEPVPTVTGQGAGALVTGKLDPFIVSTAHGGGEGRAKSVDDPMPVVCGNRGDGALVQGMLRPFVPGEPMPEGGSNMDLVISILEPLSTELKKTKFTIDGIEPWLYVFYSNGAVGSHIDSPVPTIRTHDSVGLCYPVLEFDGQFFILDIYFRMLTPRELARAQGFRDDFEFPVTKTAAVKAIGNAVSRYTATALVLALLTQDPDVGKYIKEWK